MELLHQVHKNNWSKLPIAEAEYSTKALWLFFPQSLINVHFSVSFFYASWKALSLFPAVLEKQGLCTRKKLKLILSSSSQGKRRGKDWLFMMSVSVISMFPEKSSVTFFVLKGHLRGLQVLWISSEEDIAFTVRETSSAHKSKQEAWCSVTCSCKWQLALTPKSLQASTTPLLGWIGFFWQCDGE